jgi:hypothetical protein
MSNSSSLAVETPSVTLDGVASPFFFSLQGCRDTFFTAFEGLLKLSDRDEVAFEQGQPLFYQRAEGADQSNILARAKTHLFCIALAEIRKINSNFF